MVRRKILLIALCIIAFCSCSRVQYVPQIEYQTDSVFVEKIKIDSVHIKVKEYINGDTFMRDSIVYRYILSADTIYIYHTDSVPYPVPVVKEVKAPLNFYEKTMIRLGWCLIALIVAIVGWKVVKLYGKIRV